MKPEDTETIKPKSVVVVKRAWHMPEVVAFVDHQEVGAKMAVTDFVRALATEVGSPAMMMTNAALQAKLLAAADVVLNEMKQVTAHVI